MRRYMQLAVCTAILAGSAGCPQPANDAPSNAAKGLDGVQGPAGPAGPAGPQGPAGPAGPPTAAAIDPQPGPAIAGVWQVVSGELLSSNITGDPRFLEFNQDGTALVHFVAEPTGALTCMPGKFIDFGAAINLQHAGDDEAFLLFTRLTDDNTLVMGDADGELMSLTRVAEVPAAFRCGELAEVRRFSLPFEPDTGSGLAHQVAPVGINHPVLWYSDFVRSFVAVDPRNGAIDAHFSLTNSILLVHATQGQALWGHCGCGNDNDLSAITAAGASLDDVAAVPLFGVRPESVAYDNVRSELWFAGRDPVSRQFTLTQLKTDGEPDRLLSKRPFSVVDSMSFDAGRLWVLASGNTVIEMDPVSGRAIRSFLIPDLSIRWTGLAVVGPQIFVLASQGIGQGVLAELTFTP